MQNSSITSVLLCKFLNSDEGKADLEGFGGASKATVGVILRKISELAAQGGDVFFGEPEFDTADLLRTDDNGAGIVSVLELQKLSQSPALFSTFIMWLLADLFQDLPEVGDPDKPSLVFFFDEAHLLFAGPSKAFLQPVTQTVRLIRSKGVGVREEVGEEGRREPVFPGGEVLGVQTVRKDRGTRDRTWNLRHLTPSALRPAVSSRRCSPAVPGSRR
ncbi:hypothetical protein CXR29_07175 [Brevibacterium linens]|nr:hypothetical protein CXR29_07175 [Brevibacterium linens]